jgi:hypothetical protein
MTTNKLLRAYCETAIETLQSQYRATRLLHHSATAGSAREQLIKDFLIGHLPELVTVISGQIFDAHNTFSRQQDIVLVLKSMPRLPFCNGTDLIFQEGVVSTLEIKTNLNAAILSQIGQNIESVRVLKPSIGVGAQLGITHDWPANKILTCVVTYEASSIENLGAALQGMPEQARPDLVLDLSKGLFVRNHGLLLRQQPEHTYLLVSGAAQGFTHFLTYLTEITGTLSSRGVLWRNYWN